MGTWVRLLVPMQIELRGRPTRFQAGDWIEIGKQLAQQWIAQGSAEAPQSTFTTIEGDGEVGVLVTGNEVSAKSVLASSADKVAVKFGPPELIWNRTLMWSGDCTLRFELVSIGFKLLDTWDVLYPYTNYNVLASTIGTEEERNRTQAIIRDLRVPVPDIRLIYAKRNIRTEQLMEAWRVESTGSDDRRLAFLRALYQVKPFQLPLPITWTGRGPR